jgi:molecular chaperone DnaK (HSP70)
VFALRVSHTRFLRLLDLDRPAPVTRLFTTLADGQRKAIFHFFCRQRSSRGWQPVGRIEWDSLPSGPAGEPTLELRLIPGSAGNLQLRLRERSSGATGTYQVHLPWRPRPETRKKAATPNHNK